MLNYITKTNKYATFPCQEFTISIKVTFKTSVVHSQANLQSLGVAVSTGGFFGAELEVLGAL